MARHMIEVLISSADESPQHARFRGRWLLEPNDQNWSRSQAWSIGWCWAVGEEPDGALVVYRYHVTRLQSPVLKRYASDVHAEADGVPRDILDLAFASAHF